MNICVFDACNGKFSSGIVNHWKAQGHEVKTAIYPEPDWIKESDVAWFDWVDNSLIKTSNEFRPQKKRIIARLFDVDYYAGHYGAVDWTYVDDLIFINDRIQKLVMEKITLPSNVHVHNIKCGIDLDKFTLRKQPVNNKHLVWIGRYWIAKNLAGALQVYKTLVKHDHEWRMTVLGERPDPKWWEDYLNQLIEEVPGVTYVKHVPDVSAFLEDKSHLILTSFKEAFSYVTGEAMAKGIKPVINNFPSAKDIWPKKFVYTTEEDAVNMLLDDSYNPTEYRDFIETNYSLKKQLNHFDRLLCQS